MVTFQLSNRAAIVLSQILVNGPTWVGEMGDDMRSVHVQIRDGGLRPDHFVTVTRDGRGRMAFTNNGNYPEEIADLTQ